MRQAGSDGDSQTRISVLRELRRNAATRGPAAHRTPGAVLHAKLLIVDGRRALVGSANLTHRALTANLEAGVLIEDPDLAGGLEEHVLDLMADGTLALEENQARHRQRRTARIRDRAVRAQWHVFEEMQSMTPATDDRQDHDGCQILFCHGREPGLEGRNRPCLLGVVPFGRCRNPLRTEVGFGNDFGNPRGFRQ